MTRRKPCTNLSSFNLCTIKIGIRAYVSVWMNSQRTEFCWGLHREGERSGCRGLICHLLFYPSARC
eukprot:scaffold8686_cov201-Ochromonas_danica.AAC.2